MEPTSRMLQAGQEITARAECWDGSVTMQVLFDDGGRAAAGRKGLANDCVCRSIAIATGLPYPKIYKGLNL